MNWIESVKQIKLKLANACFNNIVDSIVNAQMVLGTPGEMYLEVMNVLLKLKEENLTAYSIVKTEIEELLAFGREVNYFDLNLISLIKK